MCEANQKHHAGKQASAIYKIFRPALYNLSNEMFVHSSALVSLPNSYVRR